MMMMTRNSPLTLACSLGLLFCSACSDDGTPMAGGTSAADDDGGDGGQSTLPPATMSAGDDGGAMSSTGGADDGSTLPTGNVDDTMGPGQDSSTGAAESGSSSDDGGSTGEPADDDTLYEVQDGTIPDGTTVSVDGIVVTALASNGVFAQEPEGGQYSGIFLFSDSDKGGPDLTTLGVGDEIDIVGDTDEFAGMTEIVLTAGSLTVVTAGGPVPTPDTITAADIVDEATGEPWEGVFVRVEGDLAVTDLDPDGGIANVNEFVLDDGSDDLVIDDFVYDLVGDDLASFPGFDVGASFTAVQGPVNFSFGQHKLSPRSADDLEGYSAP